jgi:hypothetical protein
VAGSGSGSPSVEPVSFSTPPAGAVATATATLRDTTAIEVVRKRGHLIEKVAREDSIVWEDGPSLQERQKSQDLVAAWLDISRETTAALLEIPEDTEPPPVRQPLRMLDAISEDEVPDFIGSTISTAPSTPMLHPITRSRSRSPPMRRRSLEGQEEFPMRGLDTIQEAADPDPVSPRRRSLESAKRPPLESIPEFESTTTTSPKRRLVLRGLGLQRSESEPVIAHNRQSTKTKTPDMLSNSAISSSKPIKSAAAVFPRSPSFPTLQRDAPPLMGQRSKSSPGHRRPLDPTIHSLGSVAIQASIIEDDESRRLTEVAYLG